MSRTLNKVRLKLCKQCMVPVSLLAHCLCRLTMLLHKPWLQC